MAGAETAMLLLQDIGSCTHEYKNLTSRYSEYVEMRMSECIQQGVHTGRPVAIKNYPLNP